MNTKTSRAMEISKEIVVRHRCFDVDDGSYGMSIRVLESRIAQALEDYAKEIADNIPSICSAHREPCDCCIAMAKIQARAEEREACALLIQSLRGYRNVDPSKDVFDYMAKVIRARGDKA